ncbi:hypothetical protein J437_LFUL014840 [Ladona fulva]|uniref:Uncharacterized protein n=1 Tax=Ladona fulva TaxID=123851 RepID=A0A8K0KIM9_LADFU|nr:hypothetical protein J437_LFUL014840 [Ladona fulva]
MTTARTSPQFKSLTTLPQANEKRPTGIMRLIALILIVALATAAASPATSFGGPAGCRCNCPVPGQGNEVCAKEGRGPEEMFPSKCYLEIRGNSETEVSEERLNTVDSRHRRMNAEFVHPAAGSSFFEANTT